MGNKYVIISVRDEDRDRGENAIVEKSMIYPLEFVRNASPSMGNFLRQEIEQEEYEVDNKVEEIEED